MRCIEVVFHLHEPESWWWRRLGDEHASPACPGAREAAHGGVSHLLDRLWSLTRFRGQLRGQRYTGGEGHGCVEGHGGLADADSLGVEETPAEAGHEERVEVGGSDSVTCSFGSPSSSLIGPKEEVLLEGWRGRDDTVPPSTDSLCRHQKGRHVKLEEDQLQKLWPVENDIDGRVF